MREVCNYAVFENGEFVVGESSYEEAVENAEYLQCKNYTIVYDAETDFSLYD